MEHTLHIIQGADKGSLQTLRAMRTLLRGLGVEAATQAASEVVAALADQGFALIYTGEDQEKLTVLAGEAEETAGIKVVVDLDVESFLRRKHSQEDAAEGLTPEEAFAKRAPGEAPDGFPIVTLTESDMTTYSTEAYETALALMAMTDGNVIKTVANANALSRTTGDNEMYREVVLALMSTFPWVERVVMENDLLPEAPDAP